MRGVRVWGRLLGLRHAVIEGARIERGGELVVSVRPVSRERDRCGVCRRRCPRYDRGDGRRRWRALDVGTTMVFLEAHAPRVCCPQHGVVVAAVPWARHGAGHTRDFDEQVAWLATQCSKTAVTQLMRIAWRTVGSIVTRVCAEIEALGDRLDGLRRIGIDEISYKRGYRYLTVVVDHDTGRLVWAAPGRDQATLHVFFDELGPERSALITHVSADQADWIAHVVAERCPDAVRCADPFHVVTWAIDALDDVRRQAWNDARRGGPTISKGRGRARRRRRRPPAQARPLRALEEPREPHRPATRQARLDRQDRPPPLPRLPAQRRPALRVRRQRRGRQRSPRALAHLGPPLPHPRLRAPRQAHHDRPRAIDATLEHGLSNALIEVDQHQDPPAHPHRLRVPRRHRPDRPRHAQPRRPQTHPPRPTHPRIHQ